MHLQKESERFVNCPQGSGVIIWQEELDQDWKTTKYSLMMMTMNSFLCWVTSSLLVEPSLLLSESQPEEKIKMSDNSKHIMIIIILPVSKSVLRLYWLEI